MKRAHDKVDAITRAHVGIAKLAQSTFDKNLAGIANEGIFVLLVSTFEVMLSDVLICYLREFPNKMEFKDSPFATDQIVDATFSRELWEIKAESLVRSKMYQDVSAVLKYFLATLSINDCPFDQEQVDRLTELKQRRNLLIHANLVVNALYLEKAGPAARANQPGQRLSVDDGYLGGSLVTIKFFLVEIERRLAAKYASYTRLAALERLWNYMVANPKITPFADYWEIDVSGDVIRPRRNPEAEQRMGSSERLFLALWRDSLNGTSLSYSDEWLSMTCLDEESVAKVAVFLSAAKRIGVIAN
ncbi:MAG: hypothetical protein KY475_01965 [Planctomycetes bacterium]|nr:hypothetical protein [Planctomycetota bacterium]